MLSPCCGFDTNTFSVYKRRILSESPYTCRHSAASRILSQVKTVFLIRLTVIPQTLTSFELPKFSIFSRCAATLILTNLR